MHDRVINPARGLMLSAMDCAGVWLDVLVLAGACAGGWLLVRAAGRHLRMTGGRPVLAHPAWPWLVPVLMLCAGAGLLVPGDGCRDTGHLRLLAQAGQPDTQCEHPELSGVTLSRACQGGVRGGGMPAAGVIPATPVIPATALPLRSGRP
ncbi:hypothetical protein M942_00170 [Enterobacter ludwigii]|jgi:hypothetical protein|uniref:hypothetical protein n=1 Tax=Enterobacter ludwigii TaxID=299767 RepID=UPI0003D83809|nr:hypothetical protein [Enterobacter ludwigii]AHE72402.1 hypothetical protein M942_00170 [Enterobacter ludwigii]